MIGSLPMALNEIGADARVVIPLYSTIKKQYREKMTFLGSITVRLAWRKQYCGVFMLEYRGVTFYFIDNEYYFKRESMYGSFDDGERYAFFSKAILDIMPFVGFMPDILHTNDWQTALASVYLKRKYCMFDSYRRIKSVHTIHNIDYQGQYSPEGLYDIFEIEECDRQIVDYNGFINLTKGAIVCCDSLTTVSPRYAQEIRTPTYASGLQYIINDCAGKLSGILNGIDVKYYDPSSDPVIAGNFSADDISGKAKCKAELQKELSLPVKPDTPIVAMITRLAGHKGLDLVTCVLEDIIKDNDMQFIILGTGEYNYEDYFTGLERSYKDKARAVIAFDKELSKRIYAGADIFLMPSRSEPCGLAQMIASRYGTVPLVREAGGLYDSIKPYNPATGDGNGFTFANYNAHDMKYVLCKAMKLYSSDKKAWKKLVNKVMTVDFSWNASAGKYVSLYDSLMN